MFRRRTAAGQKSAEETGEHEKSPNDKRIKKKIFAKAREYHLGWTMNVEHGIS